MALTLVTPPTEWPVTLDEAKSHLRVTSDDSEDDLIETYIRAATNHVERTLGISLMERTYALTLDAFTDAIELPRGPVAEVVSVEYVDEDGVTQTVSTDDYTTDIGGVRNWIVRNSAASWASTLDAVNVVTVTYVAGYDELPEEYSDLKQAILLLIGHYHANREAVTDRSMAVVPMAVDSLCQTYRHPGL